MLNIMQRVCWNTKGWQFPSGSATEKGFPGKNGFGHEEWNFQLYDIWNGFIFPYTYSVPREETLDQNQGVFNIGFFTSHQEQKEWLFIGIHHNAELIHDSEYPEIIEAFKKNGVFKRRADELLSATNKLKSQKAALKEVTNAFKKPYIRVKSPLSDIELFPQPIPIKKPSNHRFNRFTYVDNFPSNKNSSHINRKLGSALAEDGYYRESYNKLKIIIPKHNKLSNDFTKWLKNKGISTKQEENYIDILFSTDDVDYIAELKVVYGAGTTKSVREALGQLLEYNYYPGREKKNEWMIILDQQPSKADKNYIKKLIKEFNLPLRIGWQADKYFEFYPKWDNNL